MAMEKVRTPIIITGTAVPKTIKMTTTTAIQTTMCHDFTFDPGDDQRHYHHLQSVVRSHSSKSGRGNFGGAAMCLK